MRRPGATNLAPAVDEGAEPSTQMVTPEDLAGMEREEEEPNTRPENRLPTGRRETPLSTPERRPSPTQETSQSTLSERGPRLPPVLPKRPPTPEPEPVARARRSFPTPPDPVPAVDRRRGPPVLEEVEEEAEAETSQSVTASTVNERPSSRLPALRFDEDSISDSQSSMGRDMTEPLSAATETEPEEDESTAGFTFTGTESNASAPALEPRSRTGLWLALVLLGVLIAGAAVWFLWLGPSLQPPPPMEATPPDTSSGSMLPPEQPGTGSPSGVEGEGTPPDSDPELVGLVEDTDAGQAEEDAGVAAPETEGEDAGTALAEADAGTAPEAVPVDAPTFPVRIQASSRTQLRIGGQKVRPNTTLQLPAGLVEVQYICPGRRRRTTEFIVPESPEGPVVFTVNCRLKGSR
jgi:hypothetical protein